LRANKFAKLEEGERRGTLLKRGGRAGTRRFSFF
jgi:hypothetical protein